MSTNETIRFHEELIRVGDEHMDVVLRSMAGRMPSRAMISPPQPKPSRPTVPASSWSRPPGAALTWLVESPDRLERAVLTVPWC